MEKFSFCLYIVDLGTIIGSLDKLNSVVATTRHKVQESHKQVKLSVGYQCRDHKRTQQGVSAELLPYLYNLHVVHASIILPYPKVHVSSICIPCVYYMVVIQLTYSLTLFI